MEINYGWWAIIPPIVAIILSFVTKRVLISLFAGVFSGALIIAIFKGNAFSSVAITLDTIVNQVADPWNARLLIFNFLMGAGIALIWRLNGSKALANWARSKIKTRRGVSVGAWILGIIVFFNDYCNAAIVGNAFRDISVEHKISSEKLSFVLDATAAPVATFFLSDWIAFQIGMIGKGLEAAKISSSTINPFMGYLYSIPVNMYCILMVLFVGIVAYTQRDFGKMYKAEKRAVDTGKIIRDGGKSMLNIESDLGEPSDHAKPRLISFFLPIIALVVVTLSGFYITGVGSLENGITEVGFINQMIQVLGGADASVALLWGAFSMTFVGILLALTVGKMTIAHAMNSVIDGMKLMLLACTILVLAWSMGSITSTMNLANVIVSSFGNSIPFIVLPLLIYLVGMGVAFATGTSWGTMTILTPIAIPLTYRITGDPILAVMMSGVVFSGAIFGDHCSPISDTTVLASIFAGADHIDHTLTQIPYALTVAFVSAIIFVVFGLTRLNPIYLAPFGILSLYLILRIVGKKVVE